MPESWHSGIKYLEAVKELAPDLERVLDNQPAQYGHPVGFITAIRLLMEPILNEAETSSTLSHFRKSTQRYVNSAHLYTLRGTKAKLHKSFKLNGRNFQNVLQLDFKTLRHDQNKKHSFSLWIPTGGVYRGIPIRVTDRPRWWLKVELNLDFETTESNRTEPGVYAAES